MSDNQRDTSQTTPPHEVCPACGGDCAGANPPMVYCPMRDDKPTELARQQGRREAFAEAYNAVDDRRMPEEEIIGNVLDILGKLAP